MKTAILLLLLFAGRCLGATNDVNAASTFNGTNNQPFYNQNAQLALYLTGMATNGTVVTGFNRMTNDDAYDGTVFSNLITVHLTRPGFDSTGTPKNYPVTLKGTVVGRFPYPNLNLPNIITNALGCTVSVWLDDTIYVGDTSITVDVTPGFYTIAAPPPPPPLPPNPINQWKLNEGTGNSAVDNIAGNNASLQGHTWTTGPNSDGALSFSGSLPQACTFTAVSVGNTFSVSFWLNYVGGGNPQPGLFLDASGKGLYYVDGPGIAFFDGSFQQTAASVTSGWHHVVFVASAGACTAYIDGVSSGTCTISGTYSFTQFSGVNFDALIGSMDDVRIYSGALTSTDVAQIYAAGAQ